MYKHIYTYIHIYVCIFFYSTLLVRGQCEPQSQISTFICRRSGFSAREHAGDVHVNWWTKIDFIAFIFLIWLKPLWISGKNTMKGKAYIYFKEKVRYCLITGW